MKNKLVLGKTDEGYTIFKNLDEDMVKKIRDFKMDISEFNTPSHKKAKITQKLNSTQNLCIDKKGTYFIASDAHIEDYVKDDKLKQINKKFNIVDALNKTFGTLYTHDGYRKIVFDKRGMFDYTSMGNSESGIKFNSYNGIKIYNSNNEGSSLMFCFLNADGNIENRDYNLDIEKFFDNKQKTKEDLINEVISKIPDVPYKKYNNKWFSKKSAFILNSTDGLSIDIDILDKSDGDSYGDSRNGRAKLPKSAIDVTKNHFLQQILPIINNMEFGEKVDLSKYITIDNEVNEINEDVIIPQLRVQKTIINESDYSEIYNFTSEEEEFENDIIEALKNIEQSIDIPKNVTTVIDFLEEYLEECDLPSYSFSKGEKQEDHSDYKALVKMPYGCNFTFGVCEGDVCEITWSHSIYQTDIIDLEFID